MKQAPLAMPPLIAPQTFVSRLGRAPLLWLAGGPGEPTAVIDALAADPERLAGGAIAGVFIPGVNRRAYDALFPQARIETFFVTPELQPGFAAGRVAFQPMHYTAIAARFAASRFDFAIFRVSPPRDGMVSLGGGQDFAPILIAAGASLVGVVDAATPFVPDGATVALDRFAALVDGTAPPILYAPEPGKPALAALAAHVAGLVRDSDVVQTGIGAAPAAVLAALKDHRVLTLHGGMVTEAMTALLDAGAAVAITGGMALGTETLRARIAEERRIAFRPVSQTHDVANIGAMPRFIAVNAALEVDLLGQVNGETIDGRQITGHGGMVDFARGARRSPGGRSVTALLSEARGVSRIVAALPAGAPVSIARADADLVVTEHGVADLREADVDARAERLIAVAAPAHRARLATDWAALRRRMGGGSVIP